MQRKILFVSIGCVLMTILWNYFLGKNLALFVRLYDLFMSKYMSMFLCVCVIDKSATLILW